MLRGRASMSYPRKMVMPIYGQQKGITQASVISLVFFFIFVTSCLVIYFFSSLFFSYVHCVNTYLGGCQLHSIILIARTSVYLKMLPTTVLNQESVSSPFFFFIFVYYLLLVFFLIFISLFFVLYCSVTLSRYKRKRVQLLVSPQLHRDG